ncbi:MULTISPECIES: SDR family NAD(P)-dependent oxidoreductase [unclassified Caulobacter]|uniref:SDR family NAD(P)-dependent oxidoreductase n=1 Tax=unclassified Caulobacter TaxID=2648921 RepID=UPI0006FDE6FB|nr:MULTISPECIES: SDR family oxidoreductase [unclassified Caulobacter]KQV55683.1 oxidoreductase [Caulobacter sp. Root342]KQV71146.1 oxidoreductase [Caulobacter sp. Root343]
MVTRRSVIVTGGLGDIGMAVARAFAQEGAAILLVDSRPASEDAVAALLAAGAGAARAITADVGDPDAVAQAVDIACDVFGGLDVVVNVAGMMIYRPIAELEAADWRRLLDVNLIGAALFTGHAFRRMKPGGCVINIASVHARRTSPLVAPYAAAKAALVSFTRSAAIEGKPLGVRVNAILPGAIDTAMLRDSPNIRSGAEVVDPADLGQPEDIAALTVFLASDAARFITGEDIVADGGRMGRL